MGDLALLQLVVSNGIGIAYSSSCPTASSSPSSPAAAPSTPPDSRNLDIPGAEKQHIVNSYAVVKGLDHEIWQKWIHLKVEKPVAIFMYLHLKKGTGSQDKIQILDKNA